MHCSYFDAGRCYSCTLIEQPYAAQLAGKQQHVEALLGDHHDVEWLEPLASAPEGFRNKAKMVVTGTAESPSIGLLEADIRGCPLHTPGIRASLEVLADFIGRAGLTPYDVSARRGELKYLIVTESPDGELMVRFVLRSTEAEARLRKHLPGLQADLPALRVASINLQPEHKAILEGEREIPLTDEQVLTMRVNGIALHLRPQSFFQTNTELAAALYRQARDWADRSRPTSVWDLYCGVGGFALHLAGFDKVRRIEPVEINQRARSVTGIEVSEEAVVGARLSAAESGLAADFVAGDATAYAVEGGERPDLVVVNPPRRGITDELAGWLEQSGTPTVIYSSCNALTLARDLAAMPSYRLTTGRVLDMFPHTGHYEAIVNLERVPRPATRK